MLQTVDTTVQAKEEAVRTTSLPSLLVSFLKIGSIGFGGGMAIIAVMEKELVLDRRLITQEHFVHGVGLGQGLGAFAVNVAVFTGYQLFGVTGALFSVGAFLLPSITLVMILSELSICDITRYLPCKAPCLVSLRL